MFYEIGCPHGLPHDPFKACLIPRPIAWVSSLSPEGIGNLAPFSFFNGVCSEPPVVALGISGSHGHGGSKDTLSNAEQTGEFVINVVSEPLIDLMNQSCAPFPHEVDEAEALGIAMTDCRLVRPRRVVASPVALECQTHQVIDLPCDDPSERNALLLGRVVGIHIDDAVIRDGRVDATLIRPLCRLGYMEYAVIGETFTLDRPR